MVNCQNRTFAIAYVNFNNGFHFVTMMCVVFKGFTGYLFQSLLILIFSFRDILTHKCHFLILMKNNLHSHICLPSIQTNFKININKTIIPDSNEGCLCKWSINFHLLIFKRLFCNSIFTQWLSEFVPGWVCHIYFRRMKNNIDITSCCTSSQF